jgi:hypothetical protein
MLTDGIYSELETYLEHLKESTEKALRDNGGVCPCPCGLSIENFRQRIDTAFADHRETDYDLYRAAYDRFGEDAKIKVVHNFEFGGIDDDGIPIIERLCSFTYNGREVV